MRLPLVINGEVDETAYLRAEDVTAVYNCEDEYAKRHAVIETRNGARFKTSLSKDEILARMGVDQPDRLDLLENLLARIHRDGGHYTAKHGIVKSARDADERVTMWLGAEMEKESRR